MEIILVLYITHRIEGVNMFGSNCGLVHKYRMEFTKEQSSQNTPANLPFTS